MTLTTLRPDIPSETASTETGPSLRIRLLSFASLLVFECLFLAHFRHPWLPVLQPAAGPIVLATTLTFFGWRRFRAAHLTDAPLSLRFATLHALSLILLTALSLTLLHTPDRSTWPAKAAILLWFLALLLFVPLLACTLFAPRRLLEAFSTLGPAGVYATITTVLAMTGRTLARLAWDAPHSPVTKALASATFRGTKNVLTLFYPIVVADSAHNILGTPNFEVEIAGVCSGMEGLALILVLTVGWLLYARRELRLVRAACLIPVALCLMGLLNVVRIAALIAIGDAGHPVVAVTGFHAEAGWILFNLVAFGFLFTVQRLPWVRKPVMIEQHRAGTSPQIRTNLPAIYLLPFLAILAASLLSQAASSGFEWLYPLRFIAALIPLWRFRAHYRRMDWRFGWLGPAAGVLVFVLWLLMHRVPALPGAVATGLAALSSSQRIVWMTFRVLAATLTVPLAEELAFRGYLARRIMQADVEAVPFHTLSLPAIVLSSLAFGLMHGRMAIAGFAAGLIFALLARFRGRLGEALAAHVTANLLLAVWVMVTGDYTLW